MFNIFYPKEMKDSIYDIDLKALKEKGIGGLILDVDNTLVGHGILEADENVVSWVERAKNAGIKACIVSNNGETRIIKFNERLKLPAIHRAKKPRLGAFIRAAELMELKKSEVAVIGDQVFTDIWGGNRLGMHTILVNRVADAEPFYVKLKRVLERIVLKNYKA